MKLLHPNKGLLSRAGKKYKPLGNTSVEVYLDEDGREQELDGSEKSLEEHLAIMDMFSQDEREKEQLRLAQDKELESENNIKEREKGLQQEEKSKMHTEVVQEVKNAAEAIVEAVASIPETVMPEFPDHIEEHKKWKEEIVDAIKANTPKEVDFSAVVKAVEGIKFPEIKIPTPRDYSAILAEIKKALPKDVDFSSVVKAIEKIPQPKFPDLKFTQDGRLKVEVDRIALGGGGGTGHATEETLKGIQEMPIPQHDSKVIDKTDPDNIIITYKLAGVTIATKTIAKSGSLTTITVS